MKRLILIMAVMLVAVAASAQRYSGRIETGYQFATGHDAFDQYILNTTHGVSFAGDRLFAGIGIGIGFSQNDDYNYRTLPVYADIRYSLNCFFLKPFAEFKIGYSHKWGDTNLVGCSDEIKDKGGLYIAPSLGISIPLISRFSLLVSTGYAYSTRTVYYGPHFLNPNRPYTKSRYDMGGWFVTAGIQF